MVMGERTLEVSVISAQDLKKVKNFGHQTCYAVAYINSSDKKASRVDKDGGVNPTWNAKLTLACDDKLLQRGGSYITVDIYSHGSFNNKLVGTSRISLLEIGKQTKGVAPPTCLSFEVRRPSGVAKGVLNVAVKVGERRNMSPENHSGNTFSACSDNYKREQLQETFPMGDPRVYPPTSLRQIVETLPPYPPRTASSPFSENYEKQELQETIPMGYPQPYPPAGSSPKVDIITPYPPPTVTCEHGAADVGSEYRPPGSSSATSISSSSMEEPVMAYPASVYPPAYPPQQYGTQHIYGFQYSGSQQSSYPSTQASAPYKHQKVHYSKPPRRHSTNRSSRSSGMGMGLLGGVLGGLLLGDVISDMC